MYTAISQKHHHYLPETPPLFPRENRTLDDISLCTSSIPGNGFGACAIKRIPHGTWFGPFEGKLVWLTEAQDVNTEHMWEVVFDCVFGISPSKVIAKWFYKLVSCKEPIKNQAFIF